MHNYITFYYYDKFKRKQIAATVPKREFHTMKALLLEDSQTQDLGDIYYINAEGVEVIIDYYND